VEELLLALLEALLEGLVEALLEAALDALLESTKQKGRIEGWPVTVGVLLWGALAGFASALIFPHRLLGARSPVPGLSVLLAPLVAGTAMQWFGDWRRSRGRETTGLATFRGGALFAFGMALVRFLMLGLK
jgi:hypothetical protein